MSEYFNKAFLWFWEEFAQKPIKTYEDFRTLYPEGSEGDRNSGYIMGFWEHVGAVAKHGLINHDLLFDTYLVTPFWERLKMIAEHYRKVQSPLIGENFEWLSLRSDEWARAHVAKLRRQKK